MIRINLLAPERTVAKRKKVAAAPGAMQPYLFLALFVGGTLLACAAAYFFQEQTLKRLDTEIAAAEQRQRELQAIKVQVDALEQKRATFQRKVDLIEQLKAQQSAPVHMLEEISKALPDFVWLTGLDQTGPSIRFAGQSNGLTATADFIAALQQSGWFPQVDLVSSTEADNVVTFALQATFRSPEVAAQEAAAAARQPIPGSTAAGAGR